MTTSTTCPVKVGDEVILQEQEYGHYESFPPKIVKVLKVTPKGWLQINDPKFLNIRFRPEENLREWYSQDGSSFYNRDKLYVFSQEKLDELNEAYKQIKERKKEKEEQASRQQEERKKQERKEMEEFKVALVEFCGFSATDYFQTNKKLLQDGSRLYSLDIPVKPCYRGRKGNLIPFEIMIIHCKDGEGWIDNYTKKGKCVEGYATHLTGAEGCRNFLSISSICMETDEDILWRYGCYFYHMGWF